MLSNEHDAIFRLEGKRVTRRLEIDTSAQATLTRTRGGLWFAAGDTLRGHHRLVRIDPASGKETASVYLGEHRPQALVPVAGGLWAVCGDGDRRADQDVTKRGPARHPLGAPGPHGCFRTR